MRYDFRSRSKSGCRSSALSATATTGYAKRQLRSCGSSPVGCTTPASASLLGRNLRDAVRGAKRLPHGRRGRARLRLNEKLPARLVLSLDADTPNRDAPSRGSKARPQECGGDGEDGKHRYEQHHRLHFFSPSPLYIPPHSKAGASRRTGRGAPHRSNGSAYGERTSVSRPGTS